MKKKIIALSAFVALAALSSLLLTVGCKAPAGGSEVLLPAADDPTVSFRILFLTGSQDDPPGKEGLAALTAAMVAEGATRKHSYEEVLALLYPMAAWIDARVDKEMTVISGRTHKDNLDSFYSILREVVLEPAFTKEDFKRLKTDALNNVENGLRYADDEDLGKGVLGEFIFQGTPYGHIETGHVSSLQSITLEDVRDFYERHYTRRRLVLGLGGGYDAAFVKRVASDFRTLPAGEEVPPGKTAPAPIEGMQVEIVEKDAGATAISFGFPIDVLRGSKDFYALAVANSWLGEHRNSSSHLYQVIREARGLNYGDYSYIEHFPNGGALRFPPPNVGRHHQIFEVWIRPVPNYARLFAFRAALREVQHLVDDGMTQEEFDLTRRFLKNYVLNYAPTTMMRLGYALDDRFYGLERPYLEVFREKMDTLTLADVNDAVRRHLQYKNLKVAFVTNEAEALKEMLVNDAASPITYKNPKSPEILGEDELIASYPVSVKRENVKIVAVDKVFE
jgi:zinc protease